MKLRILLLALLTAGSCALLTIPAQAVARSYGIPGVHLSLNSEGFDEGRGIVQDSGGPEVYVFWYPDPVTFTADLSSEITASLKWVYLYFGDGSGQFIEPGTTYEHSYSLEHRRYNPTLIVRTERSFHVITVELFPAWWQIEVPKEPYATITPADTSNPELNLILKLLVLDNSDLP